VIPFNKLGGLFHTFGAYIYPQAVRQTLCDFLQTLDTQASIIDIGSGTGMLCDFGHACRDDLLYHAVDPAEGMMKYAKPYIVTHKATAESLPFEDNYFDLAMMGESLHHFKDAYKALDECTRVLKKGGKLFIYDFDISTFKGKFIRKSEMFLGEPGFFFSPNDLAQKLEALGFKVDVETYNWRYVIKATL